jgi:DNA-binding transcriptional LysR family regulator
MELHQVRYFVALSEALNFTRAAEVCHVTQPAMTKGIKRLEAELGGELIFRDRQSTHLTDLGRRVLPRLREMLFAADAAKDQAATFHKGRPQVLRIGLSSCVSPALIGALLTPLAAAEPDVGFELIDGATESLLAQITQGAMCAALIGDLDALPMQLVAWQLFEERLVIVASHDSDLAAMPVINNHSLSEAVWLERPDCKHTARYWQKAFPGGRPARIAHRGQSLAHLLELTSRGLGIMLVPEHVSRTLATVARRIEGDPASRAVHLVTSANRAHDNALAAFIESVRSLDWVRHMRADEDRIHSAGSLPTRAAEVA